MVVGEPIIKSLSSHLVADAPALHLGHGAPEVRGPMSGALLFMNIYIYICIYVYTYMLPPRTPRRALLYCNYHCGSPF